MRSVVHVLLFLAWVHGAFCQESSVSAFTAETEDSISSLSIKPLKSSRTRELLKQVIRRFGQDMQQEGEVGKYRIEATFSRENLSPFSVCRTVSAKAGVALNRNDVSSAMYAFDYNGAHELNRQNSIYKARYLNQFAQLSPDHVPYISPVSMSRNAGTQPVPYTISSEHGGIHKEPKRNSCR